MRYVSLVNIMRAYGRMIAANHMLKELGNGATSLSYNFSAYYEPFIIGSDIDENSQQVTKRLYFKKNQPHVVFRDNIPDFIDMPPVLEMEWLKNKLDLSSRDYEALEQLSYMYICHFLSWTVDEDPSYDAWTRYMEESECIVEVEELDDAPDILLAEPLHKISMPKSRYSWSINLLYGHNFYELFNRCNDWTSRFKGVYYHLPLILSLFMIDYETNGLHWLDKSDRVDMENITRNYISDLNLLSKRESDRLTYGVSSGITTADTDFLQDVFDVIAGKLHDINTNIGVISYNVYNNIRGPEITQGSVRLADMKIRWNDEMERVKLEKENIQGNEASDMV